MAIVKKMKRGFTLIELMIVVVIIGVLAALAIYGVQKYVANAKSAEARQMLGRISKDHLAVFEGEIQTYAILSFGATASVSRSLCPSTANTIPAAVPAGNKTQPTPSRFRDNAGWACLRTNITTPIYYQYAMASPNQVANLTLAQNTAAAGHVFTATARGDLDNDTATSLFQIGGAVRDGGSGDLVLVLGTTFDETNPEE